MLYFALTEGSGPKWEARRELSAVREASRRLMVLELRSGGGQRF